MILTQLVYFSIPSEGMHQAGVDDILRVARHHNSPHKITGFLMYRHDLFLQVLEGDRRDLSRIYKKILTDKRHHGVVLVGCKKILMRHFGNWAMGNLSVQEMGQSEIDQKLQHSTRELQQLEHEQLVVLLSRLIRSSEIPIFDNGDDEHYRVSA